MTTLVLIRHGQSANNASPEPMRVCDPGLTSVGQQQATATAEFLREATVDGIYCSPFLRSLETTKPIAAARNQNVAIRSNLFEKGGCYSGYDQVGKRGEPGMGALELKKNYPGWEVDPDISDAGWWSGKDYETEAEARVRSEKVERWLIESLLPKGGRHIFVIHADFKAILITTLMQRSTPDFHLNELLWNVGISELHWVHGSGWRIQSLNSVEHLPTELRTR